MSRPLRIGARPSILALAQATIVGEALRTRLGRLAVEIVPIRTSGDKITSASLVRFGGKGLFVRELEEALSEGRIDIAVHSMKDLPAILPPQYRLAAVPRRESPYDVLVASEKGGWQALPVGARVGTSSLRRRLQALRIRRDLEVLALRGNVDTRMRRLRNRDFDAIILAAAGLKRLGLWSAGDPESLGANLGVPAAGNNETRQASAGAGSDENLYDPAVDRPIHLTELPLRDFVPPGGQGALAIEAPGNSYVAGSLEIDSAIQDLTHLPSLAEITAERSFLATIGASCTSPVGVNCTVVNGTMTLLAQLFSPDGSRSADAELTDQASSSDSGRLERAAIDLGERLGQLMIERGAGELIGRE
jgi:hydroxymethylbilane synthase